MQKITRNEGIHRFRASFLDPKIEGTYRQDRFEINKTLTTKLILLVAASMPGFMLTDHFIVKDGYWETLLLSFRIAIVLISLIFAFAINRSRKYSHFDTLLVAYLVLFLSYLVASSACFQNTYSLYILFDIIILISVYSAALLPVKYEVSLGIIFTVGTLAINFAFKDFDQHTKSIFILAYVFSNIAGTILSINRQKSNRMEFSLIKSLNSKTNELHELAYRDSLTGAPNRRSFQDNFIDFQKTAVRSDMHGKGVYFISADIDFFKRINDSFGHAIGDKVLIAFTQALISMVRPTDRVYRFGGEEFLIVLLDCDEKASLNRVQTFITYLNDKGLSIPEINYPVTCSFGITKLLPEDTLDNVLSRSDDGLYKAKRTGRNKAVIQSV